jgi:hypothetical protein
VDKTGTITMNQLAVTGVIPLEHATEADVLFAGALASQEANQDPIGLAFLAAAKEWYIFGGVPAARRWGMPRCGLRQPTFPRPPYSRQPPRGKTHARASQTRRKMKHQKLVARLRRHNVASIEHDAKAILPEPRSVKRRRKMKSMHCSGLVLAGILLFCSGCLSPSPISYVAPGDPVALLENVYSPKGPRRPASNPPSIFFGTVPIAPGRDRAQRLATVPPLIMVRYVDGRGPANFKVRGNNGRAYAIELPPGRHILDVRVTGGEPEGDHTIRVMQPLTIELETRAGHNYRVCAYAYDANTVSLYIEDIISGEVVSGHRPEKPVSP